MVFVRGCNYSLGNNNPALTKSTVMLMKPVGMLIGDNCSHKASQLQYLGFTTGQKVCCLYLSCLGAKDTTQSLWEMLISLLIKRFAIKSAVDHMGCVTRQ